FVGYILGKKRRGKNSVHSILSKKVNMKKIEKTKKKNIPKKRDK
ncbi:unnamed protein product, partial [marine sediment metagenome]